MGSWFRAVLCVLSVTAALAAQAYAGGEGPAPQPRLGDEMIVAAVSPSDAVVKEEDARARREREQRQADRQDRLDSLPSGALKRSARSVGGLCFAPAGADEGNGFGAEFYHAGPDGRLTGGALWFAGSLMTPDVGAPIPHEDFTRRAYDRRWGLLYLFGNDDGRLAVIGGIGPAVVQVQYIDRSNVTGWTWDGGTRTVLGLQGQLGALVHVGKKSALRLGWDSQFGGFAGLAVGL